MTINLDSPGVAKNVAKAIVEDINSYCVKTYDDGPRTHLGASLIGKPCSRDLWFTFRWAKHKVNDGRQYRLFNRGQREESRFIEWLNGIGATVYSLDPNTNKQFTISSVGGHFGGSLDAITVLPERYEYTTPLLTEFKTNGTGAGFNSLIKEGCAVQKPVHYDQQNVYGYKYGLTHSLYMNICKNDDNIHCEIIKLDLKRGADLEKKAESIILSQVPPARISEQPTAFECKYCDHLEICHFNKPLDINCRSCKNSEPRDNKGWFCNKFDQDIPTDVIVRGCQEWTDIRNV